MISNFGFTFVHNPMPAAPWRQFQISLATVGWQARFDLRLGDFIEDKPVASPSGAVLGPSKLTAARAAITQTCLTICYSVAPVDVIFQQDSYDH